MSDKPVLSDLTREQLYQLVWSSPATKLSEQLGVSDVAIAKRCRKLGVPRPERGYWAQLESGKKVDRPELPPLPPSSAEVFAEEAQKPIAAIVTLPAEGEPLHQLAAAFLAAVTEAKLSYDKQRVYLRTPELPAAEISKAQAPKSGGSSSCDAQHRRASWHLVQKVAQQIRRRLLQKRK
jgi:hypothetical protein